MKKIILFFILLIHNELISQQDSSFSKNEDSSYSSAIHLEGRYFDQNVILRWTISNYISMQEIYGQPIEIERAELSQDDRIGEYVLITTVRPSSVQSLVDQFGENSEIVKISRSIGLYKTAVRKNSDEQLDYLLSDVRAQKNHHFGIMLIAELHPEYAVHLGLGFVDNTVKANKIYSYRIKLKSKMNAEQSFSAYAYVTTYQASESSEFDLPVDSDCNSKNIILKINLKDNFKQWVYYNIERKDSEQEQWQKINDKPIIHVLTPSMKDKDLLMHHDTSVMVGVEYEYRVQAVDRYGSKSAYSPVLKLKTCDRTPPPHIALAKATQISDKVFQLTWEYPEDILDLQGFYVERSYTYEGPYTFLSNSILDPTARTFIDTVGQSLSCFYRVISFDTIGNYSQAIPIYAMRIDNIPPQKPNGLIGSIDTTGRVKLVWNLGQDEDIIGYRVYFANQEDHKFTNLTGKFVQDTVYEDTIVLKTLTKKIFYKIAALDANYNHSEFSDVLTLTKPDIVPPVMPILTNISTDIHAIHISWNNSSSDDVAKHIIHRKTDKTPWIRLQVIEDLDIHTYKDTSTRLGVIYYYSLEAIDSAGLSSGLCKAYGTGALKEYRLKTTAKLELSKEDDGVKIKVIDEPINRSVMQYVLYRSNESNKLKYLTTLSDSDPLEYLDRLVKKKEKLAYVLKVKTTDGRQSDLSEKTFIKY